MLTVWKYPIPYMTDYFSIMMPEGSQPLSVQIQNNQPFIWYLLIQKILNWNTSSVWQAQGTLLQKRNRVNILEHFNPQGVC